MPGTPSTISLHLRYRLWIAEMNFDISVLRIFDDYLKDQATKKDEPAIQTGINYFEQQFLNKRKEIDELKHEMHLLKMKLASYLRESKLVDRKTYQADDHKGLGKRYLTFRKTFEKIKNEFKDFEGRLL